MAKSHLTFGCAIFMAVIIAQPLEAAENAFKTICRVPLRIAGCATGIFVGTPIAISRLAVERYNEHVTDVADAEGRSSGVLYAIPMGLGEGIAHGLFYGPRNAVANFDKPFSKEQFSLSQVKPKDKP